MKQYFYAVIFVLLLFFNSTLQARERTEKTLIDPKISNSTRNLSLTQNRDMALGFTLDLLPIAMSAMSEEFGMTGQIWVGIEPIRLRLVGGSFSLPNWIAAQNGFEDKSTTVGAVIVDYVFGSHFDEWWIGTGFEYWQNTIGHEKAPGQQAEWSNVVWTIGGGYIWRVYGNFYIEPWVAGHVTMNSPDVTLAGKTYDPFPIMGEISLKIGWFIDI